MKTRLRGKVATFSNIRGYGFVRRDDGAGDVFVHFSEIQTGNTGYKTLLLGQTVEFEVVSTPKGDKAVDVRPFAS